MFRLLLRRNFLTISVAFALIAPHARAQALIETIAGAHLDSGPPEAVGLQIAGTAWDSYPNAYDAYQNSVWKISPEGPVERIAGTGESGFSGDGGRAVNAKLASPRNVRLDAAGNVFFLDVGNARVRKIATDGTITTVMGNGISWRDGMALEGRGTDVAVSSGPFELDAAGNLYSALGTVIRKLDVSGQVKVIAGTVAPNCEGCPNGDGGPAVAAHLGPVSYLSVDAVGGIWLFESSTNSVRRIAPDGMIRTRYVAPSNMVGGLIADAEGNAYLLNTFSIRFIPVGSSFTRITPEGSTSTIPAGGAAPNSLYRWHTGEAVFTKGTVVYRVADQAPFFGYPSVALKAAPDGTPAVDASLDQMQAIAVSHSGEVYFSQPCLLRKIDREGKLQTIAGTGKCAPSEFQGAGSMAIDGDDRLWVRSGTATYRLDADGFHAVDIQLSGALAVDAAGRVYQGRGKIERWEDGAFHAVTDEATTVVNNGDNAVFGEDGDRNVYFVVRTDDGSLWLHRVNDDGTHTAVLNVTGIKNQLGVRLEVDSAGRAWSAVTVTDGVRTATLGQTTGSGVENGFAQEAVITAVASAFGPNGDLYVLEPTRILRISGLGKTMRPQIQSVVSSASYDGSGIARGEIVQVRGSGLGDDLRISEAVNNHLPNVLGRTKVLFNGVPGAILASRQDFVNVALPRNITAGGTVNVEVQVDDAISDPFPMTLVDTAFHLYSLDSTGSGPGAILNSDLSVNSAANPAAQGSIIVLYGTGEGAKTPQQEDGSLAVVTPYPAATTPFTVKVGGKNAEVVYHSSTPTLVLGVYQINVRLPQGLPSGDVPVEVTFAGGQTSSLVTVAIQ